MKIVKSAATVLAAVASLVLISACSDSDKTGTAGGGATTGATGTAAPAPAKSLAPADQLAAAASKTGGGTYTFTMTSANATADGAADPTGPTSTGRLVVTLDKAKVTFETLFIGGTYLVKISGLPVPGLDGRKWLRLDRSKLNDNSLLDASSVKDPTGLSAFPGTVSQASTTDGRQFKGMLDLTKQSFTIVDNDAVKGLGDLAKAVPFEATVDEKGYLTSVKVSVPAYAQTKADQVRVTYSGFGTPLQAQPPAASEVIDAPEAAYRLLNGV
ncbi:hypothetical protein [Dactylosporangium sp. CA-139066]|uniref:hypothetical protein n=1 Tax=Dactylosporangium sp. CA-139066 TaxID=3239930 RepID=UPI003D950726